MEDNFRLVGLTIFVLVGVAGIVRFHFTTWQGASVIRDRFLLALVGVTLLGVPAWRYIDGETYFTLAVISAFVVGSFYQPVPQPKKVVKPPQRLHMYVRVYHAHPRVLCRIRDGRLVRDIGLRASAKTRLEQLREGRQLRAVS